MVVILQVTAKAQAWLSFPSLLQSHGSFQVVEWLEFLMAYPCGQSTCKWEHASWQLVFWMGITPGECAPLEVKPRSIASSSFQTPEKEKQKSACHKNNFKFGNSMFRKRPLVRSTASEVNYRWKANSLSHLLLQRQSPLQSPMRLESGCGQGCALIWRPGWGGLLQSSCLWVCWLHCFSSVSCCLLEKRESHSFALWMSLYDVAHYNLAAGFLESTWERLFEYPWNIEEDYLIQFNTVLFLYLIFQVLGILLKVGRGCHTMSS